MFEHGLGKLGEYFGAAPRGGRAGGGC
jgi:hypothetical protein